VQILSEGVQFAVLLCGEELQDVGLDAPDLNSQCHSAASPQDHHWGIEQERRKVTPGRRQVLEEVEVQWEHVQASNSEHPHRSIEAIVHYSLDPVRSGSECCLPLVAQSVGAHKHHPLHTGDKHSPHMQPQEISKGFEALPIALMACTWQPAPEFTEKPAYFHNGSHALMHHRGSGRALALSIQDRHTHSYRQWVGGEKVALHEARRGRIGYMIHTKATRLDGQLGVKGDTTG
jgi:hypothetical protein